MARLPYREVVLSLICGLRPSLRWSHRIVMLTAYIDDTGMDGESNLVTLAGWIASAEEWYDFSSAWDAELAVAPSIHAFHAVEAEAREVLPWSGFSETERDARVAALASLISRHRLRPAGCTVPWDWVEDNVPCRSKRAPAEDALRVCVRSVIDTVARECYADGHRDAVSIYFDRQASPKTTRRLFAIAERAARDIADGKLGRGRCPIASITFSTRVPQDKESPLQAADLLAWHINRLRHHPGEKRSVYRILQENGPVHTDVIPSGLLRKYGLPEPRQ